MNPILKDMLRSWVLDVKGNWEDYLPLVEFSYSNSYQSAIKMTPFRALYRRQCRTPLCLNEANEAFIMGPKLIQKTTETTRKIQGCIEVAQSRQKSYAKRRRRLLQPSVR